MSTTADGSFPAAWRGLLDDAAIFPPGDSLLPDAVAAYVARRQHPSAALVASFVVTDVRLPEVSEALPVALVVTGGAGAIPGALRLAAKSATSLAGLEIALRDPDDLAGNARRVGAAIDAARGEGLLDDETPVHVELAPGVSPAAWLAAADIVAEHEFRLKLRTGGLDASLIPGSATLARWIDAALDRETPFKCTAGLHRAVRHTSADGLEQHGFLNVLLATRRLFDGEPLDDVVALLESRDADTLVSDAGDADLGGARRWLTSIGSCSVSEPFDDLIALGLLETT